ncbi:MAG: hypothetical protein ABW032_12485 [Burkholderiaceae bacterium]
MTCPFPPEAGRSTGAARKCLVLAGLLGGAAAALAQSTAPSTAWGTPLGAAASAPGPASGIVARPAPSAFATARASSGATGEYFHDFGELIVRIRSVKWIEEICSEAFPATAQVNERAYDDWLMAHGEFVKEMEAQFEVIERYWANLSPRARGEGFNAKALSAKADANRAGLAQDFHATPATVFQRRCDAYPAVLLSPQLDLEKSQVDYLASVRLGPR